MSITQVQDVRDAYEGDIPADRDAWLAGRIAAAELMLSRRIGDVAAWVGVDSVRRAALVEVVAGMVLRLVRNPGALRSETEVIGPTSYSTSVDPRAASGTLWVTADDLALLGVGGDMPRTMWARVAW